MRQPKGSFAGPRIYAAWVVFAFVAAATNPGRAAPVMEVGSGVTFEMAPVIDGRIYRCLGAATRTKMLFDVYALNFCVEDSTGKAELAKYFEGPGRRHTGKKGEALAKALSADPGFFKFVVAMPVPKSSEIVFLRDVEGSKLRESFSESLIKELGKAEKARVNAFVGFLNRDIKKGDKMVLRTIPSGEVTIGVGEPRQINDERIARAVWDVFFGEGRVPSALREATAREVATLRP